MGAVGVDGWVQLGLLPMRPQFMSSACEVSVDEGQKTASTQVCGRNADSSGDTRSIQAIFVLWTVSPENCNTTQAPSCSLSLADCRCRHMKQQEKADPLCLG